MGGIKVLDIVLLEEIEEFLTALRRNPAKRGRTKEYLHMGLHLLIVARERISLLGFALVTLST